MAAVPLRELADDPPGLRPLHRSGDCDGWFVPHAWQRVARYERLFKKRTRGPRVWRDAAVLTGSSFGIRATDSSCFAFLLIDPRVNIGRCLGEFG